MNKNTNCLFYGFVNTSKIHSSVSNGSIKCAWKTAISVNINGIGHLQSI